jgi:hypothetical protein
MSFDCSQLDASAILCEDVYLEFVKNYQSVDKMAEYYFINTDLLEAIIAVGKIYNQSNSKEFLAMHNQERTIEQELEA